MAASAKDDEVVRRIGSIKLYRNNMMGADAIVAAADYASASTLPSDTIPQTLTVRSGGKRLLDAFNLDDIKEWDAKLRLPVMSGKSPVLYQSVDCRPGTVQKRSRLCQAYEFAHRRDDTQ